jgi:hypothetical protein
LPLGALAMVAGWSSSAYAQLDVSATVGLGFNVSSLTGPPSTCTSNGNPASCYLTGAIGYYNGTASASGSASDSVLAVSSAALTEGDHYGTGTPTTSVSTSFGDTLAIHNAPTSGILSLTLGYDLQSSIGCLIGGESSCLSSSAVTLLNNHSAIESALVTSANFNVSQPTANPESVTAQSTGVYVLHLSYTASEANFLLSLVSNSGCQVGFGIGYCQAQTSGKAWLEGVSVLGDPNAKISITPSSVRQSQRLPCFWAAWRFFAGGMRFPSFATRTKLITEQPIRVSSHLRSLMPGNCVIFVSRNARATLP